MNIFLFEEGSQHPVDIYSKLANDRILFVGELDDREASDIVATLLLKDLEDSETKITLIINSTGGDIRNVFMVYDMMQIVQSPIETVCVGDCMDEAVLLLAAGTKGMRYATANAVICPSQLTHDKYFQVALGDAKGLLARITRDNKTLLNILAKRAGKKVADITKDLERQKYFDAKEALAYGLIDGIVGQ